MLHFIAYGVGVLIYLIGAAFMATALNRDVRTKPKQCLALILLWPFVMPALWLFALAEVLKSAR